ncbi:MAG TPA: cytochrome C oxidase subunit IV family protein [Pyrinomonadaceae bacterium]|nr:cytochrome C oxidase subunit IV family protein [Pyrinomonadaceae bacterium]
MAAKIISEKAYYMVFVLLLVLTITTYEAARVDLGRWNAPLGLFIAACKAILIILYFMHARYSRWLTWIVVAAGLLWLGILLVLTMSDYLTRIQM